MRMIRAGQGSTATHQHFHTLPSAQATLLEPGPAAASGLLLECHSTRQWAASTVVIRDAARPVARGAASAVSQRISGALVDPWLVVWPTRIGFPHPLGPAALQNARQTLCLAILCSLARADCRVGRAVVSPPCAACAPLDVVCPEGEQSSNTRLTLYGVDRQKQRVDRRWWPAVVYLQLPSQLPPLSSVCTIIITSMCSVQT
ncbi:hypothetical protein VTN96DRAFT_190 [Rasamsonia emersonii]